MICARNMGFVGVTILERKGAEVCIGTTAMVAGLVEEMDENEVAP